MKKIAALILFLSFFLLASEKTFAQEEGQVMIVGGADLYKTDNNGLFKKAQFSFLFNFFIADKFALGIGPEYHTAGPTYIDLGPRFYPFGMFFIKALPMIPLKGNFSSSWNVDLGAGYDLMIGGSDTWAIEISASYYPVHGGSFGARGGLAAFF